MMMMIEPARGSLILPQAVTGGSGWDHRRAARRSITIRLGDRVGLPGRRIQLGFSDGDPCH